MCTGTHGTTFGGSPLATALGLHVLGRISDKTFVDTIRERSKYLKARLDLIATWFPDLVGPIRGRGLILGMPMIQMDHPGKLVSLARERGLLLLTAGKDAVRLVPSLNIGEAELSEGVDIIESCLSVIREQ